MNAGFLTVDPNDRRPAYQQIAVGVKELIARGELTEGMALPSVRQMAGDLGVNFNILVWTGGLYSQTGCNIDASITSFTIDFPFANFTPGQGTPGADFSDLTLMDFIFQSDSGIGGNSWAVTSFQAIPIGAPPGNITCAGLGK